MKKLIALFVVLFIIPTAVIAESSYVSKLNMTMDEFILKYNAVPATLESPYKSLDKPAMWTDFNGYQVAWFYPEKSSTIALLLLTKDKAHSKSTQAGLDAIQIYSLSEGSWLPLISVTKRCAGLYGEELFNVSTASFGIIEAMNYYYENNLQEKGYTSYRSLNADETLALSFGYSDGYYFSITSMDDAR